MKNSFPKKIWILWLQGISEAPFLVKKCIDSWIADNQGWEVVILDKDSLNKYIEFDLPENIFATLSMVQQSDLIRLYLLSEHGGVWADATTYCMKPLDDWIEDFVSYGFFAFSKPGRDRIMSSWFLASEKGCPLVLRIKERLNAFWMENEFKDNLKSKIANMLLCSILNRSVKTTQYWFSPVVTKLFKVYPYFLLHYMFERLISSDPECKKIWDEAKKISADGPHRIKTHGLLSPVTDDIKMEIDEKDIPLYKLTWKYDHSQYSSSTLLYYLFEGRKS